MSVRTSNLSVRAPGYQSPSSGNEPRQLEIAVSCKNLCDMDTFSKSDPLCVMSWKDPATGKWSEVGRTERIMNNLDPCWSSKFLVEYRPAEKQLVKFEVFDWDSNNYKTKKQDFLARLECTLDMIVSAQGMQYISCIKDGPSKKGKFVIVAEEVSSVTEVVKLQLAATNLDKKDFFGKSDPYFTISKSSGFGQWTVVKKSTVISNTLNPTWPLIEVPVRDLCNGSYSRQLKVEVYDEDRDKDDLIGTFSTTLQELVDAAGKNTPFSCVNPKKLSKRNYHDSGKVYVKHLKIQ